MRLVRTRRKSSDTVAVADVVILRERADGAAGTNEKIPGQIREIVDSFSSIWRGYR